MKAEREKRAEIARSLGEMESRINHSQAAMEEAINKSEGEKERKINEAEGKASEILAVAKATAEGIRKIAKALEASGGEEAALLRVSESYIDELKNLSGGGNKVVLPMDLTDAGEIISRVKKMLER